MGTRGKRGVSTSHEMPTVSTGVKKCRIEKHRVMKDYLKGDPREGRESERWGRIKKIGGRFLRLSLV